MSAPDLPDGWHVTPDAESEPTLWLGREAVLRPVDLRCHIMFREQLFAVLARVLAPDEAAVQRLADIVGRGPSGRAAMQEIIPKVLAALAEDPAVKR